VLIGLVVLGTLIALFSGRDRRELREEHHYTR